MNEGKPIPAGEAEMETSAARDGAGAGTDLGSGAHEGLQASGGAGARGVEGSAAGGEGRGRGSDGDYELSRPAGAPVRSGADTKGDFELESPVASEPGGAVAGRDVELESPPVVEPPGGAVAARDGGLESSAVVESGPGGGEGDFELEHPVSVRSGGGAVDQAPSEASDAVPVGFAAAGGVEQECSEGAAAQPGGVAHAAPAERPKPLHDPDPYGTPPYGEPGPWAPAPPVQHPGVTSAHGAGPLPLPAQEAPLPPGSPAPAPSALVPPGAPTAPPTTPWQHYDPWAPQAPFQQNGAPVATQEQRRRRTRKALVLGAVLIALVAGGIGGVVGAVLERDGGFGSVQLPQAGEEPKGRAPDSTAGIAARALPSVVTLHVKGTDTEDTGTGFVLDGAGHILTNNHVVQPAGSGGEISVTFNGGQTAKATVVGRDTGYDLAVVKVSGVRGLRPMPLGNSDNVQVGDQVVAIGAPFDLAGTVTSGIISAKERPITAGGDKGDGSDVSYVDALQTDAPINPGNSGGPLLDSRGRVVGINSAIRSADSGSGESGQAGSIGLGFAIPVNQAKRVAEELINTGKATHPVIGVTLDMNYTGDGARVGAKGAGGGPSVTRGGPGDRAGIKPGDVITEVDGVHVRSGEELIVRTRAHRPGDRLELTVVRDGAERRLTLVLGSADGN